MLLCCYGAAARNGVLVEPPAPRDPNNAIEVEDTSFLWRYDPKADKLRAMAAQFRGKGDAPAKPAGKPPAGLAQTGPPSSPAAAATAASPAPSPSVAAAFRSPAHGKRMLLL